MRKLTQENANSRRMLTQENANSRECYSKTQFGNCPETAWQLHCIIHFPFCFCFCFSFLLHITYIFYIQYQPKPDHTSIYLHSYHINSPQKAAFEILEKTRVSIFQTKIRKKIEAKKHLCFSKTGHF